MNVVSLSSLVPGMDLRVDPLQLEWAGTDDDQPCANTAAHFGQRNADEFELLGCARGAKPPDRERSTTVGRISTHGAPAEVARSAM